MLPCFWTLRKKCFHTWYINSTVLDSGRWRHSLSSVDVECSSEVTDLNSCRSRSSGSEQEGSRPRRDWDLVEVAAPSHRKSLGRFQTTWNAGAAASGLPACQDKSETQILYVFHLLILGGGGGGMLAPNFSSSNALCGPSKHVCGLNSNDEPPFPKLCSG